MPPTLPPTRIKVEPVKPKTVVYFDNSVLDAIDAQDAARRVQGLLHSANAVGYGSLQNLIEAYGIQDPQRRAHFALTLLQLAERRESEPRLHRMALAVVRQLRKHHGDWLNPSPMLDQIRADVGWARQAWVRIRQDPTHRPRGFIQHRALIHDTVAESMQRQRRRRAEYRKGELPRDIISDPDLLARLQPDFEALDPIERVWRQDAGVIWWSAVVDQGRMVLSLRDWMRPYLRPERLDLESWMRFWLSEIDARAVNDHRIEQLAAYFQVKHKISAGNSGDMHHAGFAAICDVFLTADRAFFQVLSEIQGVTKWGMARPALIDRAAEDIVAEVGSAMRLQSSRGRRVSGAGRPSRGRLRGASLASRVSTPRA